MHQARAVIWFLTGIFIGCCNDIFVRFLIHIPVFEISCFRFLFSSLSLIPFINKDKFLASNYKKVHFIRGFLFLFAVTFWEIGIKSTQLSTATLIGFSGPFSFMILSILILKERADIYQIFATTISFLSVLGIIEFNSFSFDSSFLILLVSSLFFSLTDILNKKYSALEDYFTAIIYYNMFAFLISIPFLLHNFIMPSSLDLFYMFCLGIESNIYSFALLKAFSICDATFIAPFRYFEFVFAIILGYAFFYEIPTYRSLIVMLIIVTVNLIVLIHENTKRKIY